MFANLLFWASAILTVGSAIAVATTKNIMHACVYLLGTLIGVAGLYLTLNADFVAAVQIMVYVGGVVILMLFAVMLTGGKEFMDNVKERFHFAPYMGNLLTYIYGSFTAIFMIGASYNIIKNFKGAEHSENIVPFTAEVERIGELLLTDHVLVFELSSVLLLGALIGAAIIARPRS